MSVIGSNILAGASGQGGVYNLTKSLRFRSSASAYLNKTFASNGTRTTGTYSTWFKIGKLPSTVTIPLFGCGDTASDSESTAIAFFPDFGTGVAGTLSLVARYGGGTVYKLFTSAVFRDPSAWYHIVVSWDTTLATPSGKIYINGVEQSYGTNTWGTQPQNQNTYFSSSAYPSVIGKGSNNADSAKYADCYMAEVNFIDGQALTPSSFGETSTSTGVWIPKKFTGTYGTNGFYLDFEDTSSTAALGYDAAGSNDWTVNNISLTAGTTYDSMNDVPTLTSATTANYCTWNPNSKGSLMTVTGGNLNASTSANGSQQATEVGGTVAVSSGKWYWELTITASDGGRTYVGVGDGTRTGNNYGQNGYEGNTGYGQSTGTYGYFGSNGNRYQGDGSTWTNTTSAYGNTYTTNDVIGVALDLDNGKIWFSKNGTWQASGDPAAGTNAAFTSVSGLKTPLWKAYCDTSPPSSCAGNFGQRAFAYTPPTGFVALNTFNLPTPTIGATASELANKYMDVSIYTGNSTNGRTVSNSGSFQPDFVWVKSRTQGQNNQLFDAIRGTGNALASNTSAAEITNEPYGYLSAFNSTGFALTAGSLGSDYVNLTGQNYVGWQWRGANGTVSNTQGSITSTVSANTTAGFSIVTYTGTGANATVGHGLGAVPSMYIVKKRSAGGDNWAIYHISTGNTNFLRLDTTNAAQTFNLWQDTTPTSSVFYLSSDVGINGSGATFVAYCFAPVAGYSAFGSYTGNGSSDGTFVYTGFRPRFLLIKKTSVADWFIYDTARNTYNTMTKTLESNTSNAERDNPTYPLYIDDLSNGFKCRVNDGSINDSGATYIYMAFAESPFKYANAR